ncbi:MAG TPA: hypothetical protein VFE72_05490, partial [Lysobacter sp.]|nr:hypothetical protein [Lysobacter sp.]
MPLLPDAARFAGGAAFVAFAGRSDFAVVAGRLRFGTLPSSSTRVAFDCTATAGFLAFVASFRVAVAARPVAFDVAI